MALINKLKAIGDAIRAKTGKTDEFTLDQMVTEIEGIEGGSSGGSGGVVVINSSMALGKNESIANIENLKVSYPYATVIPAEAFANTDKLLAIDIPNVITIEQSGFLNCTALTVMDLPKTTIISNSAFFGCTNLSALILRNTERVCFVDVSALLGTKILTDEGAPVGEGFVYVPSALFGGYVSMLAEQGSNLGLDTATSEYIARAVLRKIEDYPEICG